MHLHLTGSSGGGEGEGEGGAGREGTGRASGRTKDLTNEGIWLTKSEHKLKRPEQKVDFSPKGDPYRPAWENVLKIRPKLWLPIQLP